MTNISQQQLADIINQRQEGVEPQQIIDEIMQSGNIIEGFEQNATQQSGVPSDTTPLDLTGMDSSKRDAPPVVQDVKQLTPPISAAGLGADVNLVDVGIGAAKGLFSTIQSGAGLVEKGIRGTLGLPQLQEPSAIAGQQFVEEQIGLEPGQITTPQNLEQSIGFTAEQIGEFVIPAGKLGTIEKSLGIAGKGIKKLLGRAIIQGMGAAAVSAAQEGEINQNVATEAGLASVLTTLFGIPGQARGITKAIRKKIAPTRQEAFTKAKQAEKKIEELALTSFPPSKKELELLKPDITKGILQPKLPAIQKIIDDIKPAKNVKQIELQFTAPQDALVQQIDKLIVAAGKNKVIINKNNMLKPLKEFIEESKEGIGLSDANIRLLQKQVDETANRFKGEGISVPKAQKMKKEIWRTINTFFNKSDTITAAVKQQGLKRIGTGLQKEIERTVPGAETLNKSYGELEDVLNIITPVRVAKQTKEEVGLITQLLNKIGFDILRPRTGIASSISQILSREATTEQITKKIIKLRTQATKLRKVK